MNRLADYIHKNKLRYVKEWNISQVGYILVCVQSNTYVAVFLNRQELHIFQIIPYLLANMHKEPKELWFVCEISQV